MTHAEIINRIHDLEHQLKLLKQQVDVGDKRSGGWRETAGTFANDPLFEKAMQYGAEYRRSTLPKSRSRKVKRR